jgi:hypothetical protein
VARSLGASRHILIEGGKQPIAVLASPHDDMLYDRHDDAMHDALT